MTCAWRGSGRFRVGVKQALTEQLVFQVFERFEQRAATRGARHVADELQPPAGGPDRGAPAQLHAGAVDNQKPRSHGGRAVHHAIDDRVFSLVFEAKIDVPAGGWLRPRDLADHPDVERGRLYRALQSPIEIGYRIDEDLFGRGHGAEPSTTQNLALTLTSAPLRALEGAELREDAGLPY